MTQPAPQRNDVARANLASYQLFANVYRGDRWVRRPPKGTLDPFRDDGAELNPRTYLRPFPNETTDPFEARVRRASYENHCQDIINAYLATFFARGATIDRQLVASAIGAEVFNNIDLRRSNAAAFMRRVEKETLLFGWCGVLTDYPRAGKARSARAEAEAGGRPYSRVVVAPNVWDWTQDPTDGSFLYLLINQGYHPAFGLNVWAAWWPEAWLLIDAEGNELDGGPHTLGAVPFDLCICDMPSEDVDDEPFGHSALRDVATLAIEHFNLSSELEDLLRKTNFPQQHWKEDPNALKAGKGKNRGGRTKPAGPDHAIVTECDVKWLSPDVQAAMTTMKRMDALERAMRRTGGVSARSEESTEAHSGAALTWEYADKHDKVKLRAENLRSFEVALWLRYGEIMGRTVPAESVQYPSEYATAPLPGELSTLEALNKMKAPKEIQRAQLRSITLKAFSHRPESEFKALLAAAEAWEPDGAGEPKPTPPTDPRLVVKAPPALDPAGAAEPPMMGGEP